MLLSPNVVESVIHVNNVSVVSYLAILVLIANLRSLALTLSTAFRE